MVDGPCVICGATRYSLSMGGPTICPSCDCGDFGLQKVQRQAREIESLRNERDAALARMRELEEALSSARETLLGFGQYEPGQRINRAGAIMDAALSTAKEAP